MSDLASERPWKTAAICLRMMAIFNALLLGYVHLLFAMSHPDYYTQAWPSFSRALSDADLTIYRWFAAAAAVSQVVGCAAVAYLHLRQARGTPIRGTLLAAALAWSLASALGIVHYLHMTIVVNSAMHMLLSYVFFFGMTIFVVADAASTATIRARIAPVHSSGLVRGAQGVAAGVVASGLVFLVTYFLKDAAWNPGPSQTQKVFVAAEVVWVILCHLYVLLRLERLQRQPGVNAERFCGVRVDMNVAAGAHGAGKIAR